MPATRSKSQASRQARPTKGAAKAATPQASLALYRQKRDFTRTPEPSAEPSSETIAGQPGAGALQFVIQKHWASHLHYDFRLELDGSMKSWAVPKGPSYDPADKRMAVQVEDHPMAYNRFEGQIPPGTVRRGQGHHLGPWHLAARGRCGPKAIARASSSSNCAATSCRAAGPWCACAARATPKSPPGC